MIEYKLIIRKINFIILIWFIFPITLLGQSTWIYGIQDEGVYTTAYLVRLNYLNGQYDSILYLGDQNIDDFGSCIDPYNGRLFLSGLLYGQDGFLHEIDLNTLEIVSYDKQYQGKDIEYNLLNNSIIYRLKSSIWKLDLNTQIKTELDSIETYNGYYWGNPRNYNPVDNTYYFELAQDYVGYFFVVDAFTGITKCKTRASTILQSMVVDYESGKHYGRHGGSIYEFDPYTGDTILLFTIPDYRGWLNEQQSVYDQINKKYIVPYIAIDDKRKISVIDMEEYTIDTSYIQPNSSMNLHEIYCKPRTYLSLINDTLYTSYGSNYQWYINGFLNPFISTQFCSPYEYGDYQTLVDYPEYSSLSNRVTYLYTNLNTSSSIEDIEFSPNPFLNTVRVIGKNEFFENSTLLIFNSFGAMVYNSTLENSYLLNLAFLKPGLYTFIIEQNGAHLMRKKMVKTN